MRAITQVSAAAGRDEVCLKDRHSNYHIMKFMPLPRSPLETDVSLQTVAYALPIDPEAKFCYSKT
jgi:hypothetical protein